MKMMREISFRSWAVMIPLTVLVSGLLSLVGRPQAQAGEPAYVGWKKCKMCHLKEWKSWAETPMGKALEVLKAGQKVDVKTKAKVDPQKDYSQDAACVKCHVTGLAKPGGYDPAKPEESLANVGCESCHGPGSAYQEVMKKKDYKRDDAIAAGMIVPDEKVCVTCHNKESPFFPGEFKFDKDKGIHEHVPLKNPH
jgi:cytochrome c554/c'-like protein